MAKVTERVEGSYEVQEMEFGRIYTCVLGTSCSSANAARGSA
jgi:hypothetical protein